MFSLLILRHLEIKPHSLDELASKLYNFRAEGGRIEFYLGELLHNSWIKRDNKHYRITDRGLKELTETVELLTATRDLLSDSLMRLLLSP